MSPNIGAHILPYKNLTLFGRHIKKELANTLIKPYSQAIFKVQANHFASQSARFQQSYLRLIFA